MSSRERVKEFLMYKIPQCLRDHMGDPACDILRKNTKLESVFITEEDITTFDRHENIVNLSFTYTDMDKLKPLEPLVDGIELIIEVVNDFSGYVVDVVRINNLTMEYSDDRLHLEGLLQYPTNI